jgi:hypothetical protein
VAQPANFLRVLKLHLGLVGRDETDCEAAYDCHVTAAAAREIVLELDIE